MHAISELYDWLSQRTLTEPSPSWLPLGWPLRLVWASVALLATALAVWGARHFLWQLLQRLVSRTATRVDDAVLATARVPVTRLLGVSGLHVTAGLLPLPEAVRKVLQGVLYAVGALVVVQLMLAGLRIALHEYMERTAARADARLARDFIPLVSKAGTAMVVLTAFALVLSHFGQDPTALLGILGVGTFALGFAAKAILENTFAGFVILLDRPFRPGDRIRTANGQVGDVIDIGLRATQVKLLDGNVLIVPNAEFVSSQVVNFAYPNRTTRGGVDVGVAYGSDLERAKTLLLEAARGAPAVLADPPPGCAIVAFGENAVSLRVGFACADYTEVGAAEDEVRARVAASFAKAGVEIPLPQRVVQLQDGARPAALTR